MRLGVHDGELAVGQRAVDRDAVVDEPLQHGVGGAVGEVDDLLPGGEADAQEARGHLPELLVAARYRARVHGGRIVHRGRAHVSPARKRCVAPLAPSVSILSPARGIADASRDEVSSPCAELGTRGGERPTGR